MTSSTRSTSRRRLQWTLAALTTIPMASASREIAHLWPTAEDRVRDAAAHLFAEVVGSGEGTVRAERA